MRSHKTYMAKALQLSKRGKPAPNPLVGAVVVKRGQIVGQGYHKKAGEAHAETLALEQAGNRANNATLYVTLEPCSHWGRTPPCTDRIVRAGIREVIIGMSDINPKVNGIQELKGHGLKIKSGILQDEIEHLNEAYLTYMDQKRPFVILKVASTLDGRVATRGGESKYITGLHARREVHNIRSQVDAVIVGSRTVIRDDPQLTTRLVKGKNPLRVVIDSQLRTPAQSRVFKGDNVVVATTQQANKIAIREFEKKGIDLLTCRHVKGKVNLKYLLGELAKRNVSTVMVEGGPTLNSAFLSKRLVDKMIVFLAPGVLGDGVPSVNDLGIRKLNKAIKIGKLSSRQVGRDILLEGYIA